MATASIYLPFPASIIVLDASEWARQNVVAYIFVALNGRLGCGGCAVGWFISSFAVAQKMEITSRSHTQMIRGTAVLWTTVSTACIECGTFHFCNVCDVGMRRTWRTDRREKGSKWKEKVHSVSDGSFLFFCCFYFLFLISKCTLWRINEQQLRQQLLRAFLCVHHVSQKHFALRFWMRIHQTCAYDELHYLCALLNFADKSWMGVTSKERNAMNAIISDSCLSDCSYASMPGTRIKCNWVRDPFKSRKSPGNCGFENIKQL